jgi:prepilin-type N-terminal cleavage/methylation domain-containing protein
MKIFSPSQNRRAFTMVEIAICLAIIGIGLVGIIGVLPYGMNTQRDNREETVIGQDASHLIELIRNGTRGADDLTNYVVAITNTVTFYDGLGIVKGTDVYGYTFAASSLNGGSISHLFDLNCGTNIIGLLSTPEFLTNIYGGFGMRPLPNVFHGGYSNHVVAYVRSISGLAAEKPPQDNQIMREDTFTYRLFVLNAPVVQDSNTVNLAYNRLIGGTFHELRMTFLWPLLPNGQTGSGRHTFRTAIAGDLRPDPNNGWFYYGPQTFSTQP